MKNKINFLKNRFILNLDYFKKKTYLNGYPVEVTIELTNWCNLDCIFCPHAKMKRKQGFMDLSLFKKIINEIAGFVESVGLDLMGESAMHPEIFEMIKYCKKAGLKTTLNSNMSNVNEKLANSLIDSGLDMLIMSIDGAYKNTYESIRLGASFEKAKENIITILQLNSKNLYKVVQMVYIKNNMHEAAQFIKDWRNKGADFVRIQPYQNVDRQNIELNTLPMRDIDSKKPCIHPWKKIAVCWDGIAVLCCYDYDKFGIVGDVTEQNIFDIWNGSSMQNFRRRLIARNWNSLPFCKNCFSFEPSKILLWGSTFVNPIQIRKLLFCFERLMVFHKVYFFRYF